MKLGCRTCQWIAVEKLFERAKWSCSSYLQVYFLVLSCCYQTKHSLLPPYLPVIYIHFCIIWVGVCLHSKWKAEIFPILIFFLNYTMNCTFHLYVPANQTHLFYKAESLTLGVSTANWMCSSENEVLLSLTPPVPPEIKCNSSFADRSIRAEEGSPHLCLMAQVGIEHSLLPESFSSCT